MGNSNVSLHSKWRVVSPENSLLDLHQGQCSRSSEVPNALVCWNNQMQRNTNGIWAPMSQLTKNSSGRRNGEVDPFDRNKMVGFFGGSGSAASERDGKKIMGKRKQQHIEVKRNLYVSDEIISSPMAQTNISILYNEDILQHPKHCSLATAISADLDNQLEHDAISRFQRKFGRYDEVMRQGQQPEGLVILTDAGRFIYYLITKKKYWESPCEENLEKSFMTMATHCNDMQVHYLAISNVTGGALNWNKVLQIVSRIFKGMDIRIYMYK